MNTSTLSIQYSIELDSQSLLRYKKAQELPFFIKQDPEKRSLVGESTFTVYCENGFENGRNSVSYAGKDHVFAIS